MLTKPEPIYPFVRVEQPMIDIQHRWMSSIRRQATLLCGSKTFTNTELEVGLITNPIRNGVIRETSQ